jgi:hypothetical protein
MDEELQEDWWMANYIQIHKEGDKRYVTIKEE